MIFLFLNAQPEQKFDHSTCSLFEGLRGQGAQVGFLNLCALSSIVRVSEYLLYENLNLNTSKCIMSLKGRSIKGCIFFAIFCAC